VKYDLENPVGVDASGNPLTVRRQILSYVRAGAYPHIAAEAAGIPAELFGRWLLKKGKKWTEFADELRQAAAQARIRAEIEVIQANPRAWLREGPGREMPDSPGWSGIVRPIIQSVTNVNVLASPEWNQLWSVILSVLGQYPEARAALAEALGEFDLKGQKPIKVIPPPPTAQ